MPAEFAVHGIAMHLKTVPLTLAVGMQQLFRVRVGLFPLWIVPKPHHLLHNRDFLWFFKSDGFDVSAVQERKLPDD